MICECGSEPDSAWNWIFVTRRTRASAGRAKVVTRLCISSAEVATSPAWTQRSAACSVYRHAASASPARRKCRASWATGGCGHRSSALPARRCMARRSSAGMASYTAWQASEWRNDHCPGLPSRSSPPSSTSAACAANRSSGRPLTARRVV